MGRVFPGLFGKNALVFCLLQLFSCLIYLPITGNSFLADDYRVMNRVGLNGDVFVNGFFRPLSDISLYLNYLVAGLSPMFYYITNIFLHACCSFMIYIFCRRIDLVKSSEAAGRSFPLFAALLFLTYPFHNEAIAWIVGRASLLATFFGLATLLVYTGTASNKAKYCWCGLLYFIGLSAYESIFPLPAIVILLSWTRYKSVPLVVRWTLVFLAAIALHLILRIRFSGVVTGDYGQDIFSLDLLRYVSNLFKITGRLLLPPSDNSTLLLLCFSALVTIYLVSRFVPKPKMGFKHAMANPENQILLMLAIALIVPLTFSVSTRTSEGDRLLYFPSVFICLLFAYLIVRIRRQVIRITGLCCLLIYNVIFLEINNAHWIKASQIAERVLNQVGAIKAKSKHILLLNVPGEYRGAYVFRNAFEDALVIRGIDTTTMHAVNYLNHSDYQSLADPITPRQVNDSLYIGNIHIVAGKSVIVKDFNRLPRNMMLSGHEELWFWNKHKFVSLPLQ